MPNKRVIWYTCKHGHKHPKGLNIVSNLSSLGLTSFDSADKLYGVGHIEISGSSLQ